MGGLSAGQWDTPAAVVSVRKLRASYVAFLPLSVYRSEPFLGLVVPVAVALGMVVGICCVDRSLCCCLQVEVCRVQEPGKGKSLPKRR